MPSPFVILTSAAAGLSFLNIEDNNRAPATTPNIVVALKPELDLPDAGEVSPSICVLDIFTALAAAVLSKFIGESAMFVP